MAAADRIYRMSATGRRAWESEDTSVPAAYRRILGMVDTDTHTDVLRGYLRRYPDRLILEWLMELEELGLVESRSAGPTYDLDFTGSFTTPMLIPEDRARLAQDTQAAGGALSRKGVYLADDRLRHRPALQKSPGETLVLIVEDDPDVRESLELFLNAEGYRTTSTVDGEAAIRVVEETGLRPDLVIVDFNLPTDLTGLQVMARLRATLAPDLPALVLTGDISTQTLRKIAAEGYDHRAKPVATEDLSRLVSRLLKKRQPRTA